MTTVLCPKCETMPAAHGLSLCSECAGHPVPAQPERTYQEPLLAGGVYHCPKCDAPLEAGAKGCAACLVQFMRPIPEVRLTPPGAFAPPKSVARKKPLPWGAFVGAVLLLAAIGFGFHAYKSSIVVTHPLATRLRLFHKGDSWEYRANGIVTISGGMTALLGDGNAITLRDGTLQSVISAAAPGIPLNTYTEADTLDVMLSYRGRATPITYAEHRTFSQDPAKATTRLLTDESGPNKVARRVLLPKVDTPGVWSDKMTQDVRLDFDDNERTDETMTVQGSEVVDTALGRFNAWKCVEEHTNSNGVRASRTSWFAPQLGMPVKTTETVTITRAPPPMKTLSAALMSALMPATFKPGDPVTMVMTVETEITKTNVPLD